MADPQARIRFSEKGKKTVTVDAARSRQSLYEDSLPCKEWSIADDVMCLSDTACVTIPNVDGENSGRIKLGQRVEIEVKDDDVRNGSWCRAFTGVVTETRTGSDASGGSVISITMQDLGWFLTSCDAKPLVNIKRRFFKDLLKLLIDPSWGITKIIASNDLNRRIKHGRQVIIQNFKPVLGAILPYIQVEPGQKPADIILQYAAREGVLVNFGAGGELIFFQPDYSQQALFSVDYSADETLRKHNNIVGRPEVRETIDGLFGEVQCWSTVVIDQALTGVKDGENPNASYRHTVFTPDTNPLPFNRRVIVSDPEAINPTLRTNRAKWKQQMGLFQSWEYTVQFDRHSQDGAFFVSDSMIEINDEVNAVRGVFYVQSVRRSMTLREGARAHLTIRKPVLDPNNTALNYGGTKDSSKTKKRNKPLTVADIERMVDNVTKK